MRTVREWEVLVYFAAVLTALGLLFAVTVVPGDSSALFPNASPDELVQGAEWVWGKAPWAANEQP